MPSLRIKESTGKVEIVSEIRLTAEKIALTLNTVSLFTIVPDWFITSRSLPAPQTVWKLIARCSNRLFST